MTANLTRGGPDLIDIAIIGVPKAGTSSLFTALTDNPLIRGTSPKETFFFMDSSSPLFRTNGYALLSDGVTGFEAFLTSDRRDTLQLEGTTQNIYSETALKFFKQSRNTRLIISLREPASRIYSLFRYVRDQQCNLDGNISFGYYVELLLSGAVGTIQTNFRSKSSYYALANALTHSDYVYWLDRWKPLYDAGRLKIILFEELKTRPDFIINEIMQWLEIQEHTSGAKSFPESNKTNRIGSRKIHRALQRFESRLPAIVKTDAAKKIYYLFQAVSAMHKTRESNDSAHEALMSLRSYFRYNQEELKNRYGIDTDCWWPR